MTTWPTIPQIPTPVARRIRVPGLCNFPLAERLRMWARRRGSAGRRWVSSLMLVDQGAHAFGCALLFTWKDVMRVPPLMLGIAAIVLGACSGDSGDQASRQDLANEAVAKDKAAIGDAFGAGSGGAMPGTVAPTRGRVAGAVGEAGLSMPSPPPAPAMGPPSEPGAQLPVGTLSAAPSMLIRTGDARVEVDSLEIALARLQALAARVGGFIGSTSMQAGEREVRQATIELKVPAERFDLARSGLSEIGKVEYVNVQAHDVGEEYVDVTARMENARRLEQRLVALLASRTGRLEEVLSVERELNRIRETIERYEGRLRYLRTRAAVSTLMINVHEKAPLVGQLGSGNRIIEAFRTAWRNFVGFLALFIESLGVLIPLGIIALVIGRWMWRRRPPRTAPPAAPVTASMEERRP